MNEDLLQELCGQHPARRMDFDDLFNGILDRSEKKSYRKSLININREGGLLLANYSHYCVFSRSWDIFTAISRGLILDVENKRIIATPFPKFFNWGEHSIFWIPDNKTMTAYDKIDGCLGIIYYYNNCWNVASRGSLSSDVSSAAQAMLEKYNINSFEKGYTYIVEIVHEDHRIVVPYDYNSLILLSVYDVDGNEISPDLLPGIASKANMRYANFAKINDIDRLTEKVKNLPYTEEGFVVRFDNGHRFKIKSPAYLRKHKVIFNFGPLRVWELLLNKESLNEYMMKLPEEFKDEFNKYVDYFKDQYNKVLEDVALANEKTKYMSDKELGKSISSLNLPENGKKFLFEFRKKDFYNVIEDKNSSLRSNIFKTFRPKHNIVNLQS